CHAQNAGTSISNCTAPHRHWPVAIGLLDSFRDFIAFASRRRDATVGRPRSACANLVDGGFVGHESKSEPRNLSLCCGVLVFAVDVPTLRQRDTLMHEIQSITDKYEAAYVRQGLSSLESINKFALIFYRDVADICDCLTRIRNV